VNDNKVTFFHYFGIGPYKEQMEGVRNTIKNGVADPEDSVDEIMIKQGD